MFSLDIPARNAPCWSRADWRTEMLRNVKNQFGLGREDLCELTGATDNTVRFWLSNHEAVIPTDTLRALMYDLNARIV